MALLRAAAWCAIALSIGCSSSERTSEPPVSVETPDHLIPVPASSSAGNGQFVFRKETAIYVAPDPALVLEARRFAAALRTFTGLSLPVVGSGEPQGTSRVLFERDDADAALSEDAYSLTVSQDSVRVRAGGATGAFYAVQTLRQLLPASLELGKRAEGGVGLPVVTIVDAPRYPWRGLMLDIARHFFPLDALERYVNLASRFKINRFHVHLTDDQGWRIEIKSWPNLTQIGGSTEVGGGPGGFLTQDQFRELVSYAADRHVTIVPEIDMPGHVNAALASYPELNCDGVAPPLYTGTDVGLSSLCISKSVTYDFARAVIGEIAELVPGGYLHIGGDESYQTAPADYVTFLQTVAPIVASHGLKMVGWEEVARSGAVRDAVAQIWLGTLAPSAVAPGTEVILSPIIHTYLDQKYTAATTVGHNYTGYIEVDRAYDFEPSVDYPYAGTIGVEGALWTAFVETDADADYMIFPRILGHAEIGWSLASTHDLSDYLRRLGANAPRLDAMGIQFYRSPLVNWEASAP